MRKFVCTLLLLSATILMSAQDDSLKLAGLLKTTDNYLTAIERENTDFKSAEADFMIESCSDSSLRQTIALRIYDYYSSSRVMGDEAVVIHLTDKWFSPHIIEMRSDIELLDARIYADFNRKTLIGEKAPEAVLEDINGDKFTIPTTGSLSVIYLYDTECSTCRIESILLKHFLEETEAKMDFFAIYIGNNRDSWEEFVYSQFDINSATVRVHNLWDPDSSSDITHNYGALHTPVMLLVDKESVILGRGLDTAALQELLGYVRIYSDLYSRCEIGTKVPDFKLPATLVRGTKSKKKDFRLNKAEYVIFHSEGCTRCQAELQAMQSSLEKGTKVLLVNVDNVLDKDPELGRRVLDSFDLTVLPFIMRLDRKGTVQEKYVSFLGL